MKHVKRAKMLGWDESMIHVASEDCTFGGRSNSMIEVAEGITQFEQQVEMELRGRGLPYLLPGGPKWVITQAKWKYQPGDMDRGVAAIADRIELALSAEPLVALRKLVLV